MNPEKPKILLLSPSRVEAININGRTRAQELELHYHFDHCVASERAYLQKKTVKCQIAYY